MSDYDKAPTDPHHGGKIWDMAMIQEARAQQKSLVSAGREQAAAWHDARRKECLSLRQEHAASGREMLSHSAQALADFHGSAAASIRSLTD